METLEEYPRRKVQRDNVDLSECKPAEPLEIAGSTSTKFRGPERKACCAGYTIKA